MTQQLRVNHRGYEIIVEKRVPHDKHRAYKVTIVKFVIGLVLLFPIPEYKTIMQLTAKDVDAGIAEAKAQIDWIEDPIASPE